MNILINIFLIMHYFFVIFYSSLIAEVIKEDKGKFSEIFSSSVAAHVYHNEDGIFFAASSKPSLVNDIAISVYAAGPHSMNFTPLLQTKKVKVNGETKEIDPLKNTGLLHLALLGRQLVLVTEKEPAHIYLLQNSSQDETSLLAITDLKDSSGSQIKNIVAIATNSAKKDVGGLQQGMMIYAVVEESNHCYGVASIILKQHEKTGILYPHFLGTAPLSQKIDSREKVSIHVIPELEKIYIGLSHQKFKKGNYKVVHALIGIQMKATIPDFFTLMPDQSVDKDSIIATSSGDKTVSVYDIKHMITSTQLCYLIIQGDNALSENGRGIFALPIENGLLANKNSLPVDSFSELFPFVRMKRELSVAQRFGDLMSSADIACCVGGEEKLPGTISSCFVAGDAVFVSVTGKRPGMFHSQALFSSDGRIQGWTRWRSAGASINAISNIAVDERMGNIWSLEGIDKEQPNVICRTSWKLASDTGMFAILKKCFLKNQNEKKIFSLQAVFDIPGYQRGVTPIGETSLLTDRDMPSLVIATGKYGEVVMVQTAQCKNGMKMPLMEFDNGFISDKASLEGFIGADWIFWHGGDLAKIGTIHQAIIMSDDQYGWVVVAGSKGMAVLSNDDGTGWDIKKGIGAHFKNLPATLQWRLLDQRQGIKKIVAHYENLSEKNSRSFFYLLTSKTLERRSISSHFCKKYSTIQPSIIFSEDFVHDISGGKDLLFFDLIITKKLCLLATNRGLLRNENGTDITDNITDIGRISWRLIPLHDTVFPSFTHLYGVSVNGLEGDLLQQNDQSSGNIYVMNSFFGYHRTSIYRLSLHYSGVIDDTTVQVIADNRFKEAAPRLFTGEDYHHFIATDGVRFFIIRNCCGSQKAVIGLLHPLWRMLDGKKAFGLAQSITPSSSVAYVGKPVYISSYGFWLIPGDFLALVNE